MLHRTPHDSNDRGLLALRQNKPTMARSAGPELPRKAVSLRCLSLGSGQSEPIREPQAPVLAQIHGEDTRARSRERGLLCPLI